MGQWIKNNWWLGLATLAGVMFTAAGLMYPFEGEVEGGLPWWGGMLVMLAFGGLLLGGVWQRRHRRVVGDVMIAVGTLPLFPLFWTVILPVLGLLIAIPAILDAADARATGTATADQAARDTTVVLLLSLTLVAVAAAAVVGTADAAFGLVSPPLSLFAGHLAVRSAAMTPTRRLGLTGVVAGMIHVLLTVTVVVLADNGAVEMGTGLPVVASTVMSIVTFGGLVLAVFGRPTRDRARPT